MAALSVFEKNIERAKDLFSAHRTTFPKGKPPANWGADILRSSLVFAVAALDAYMHDKIAEVIPAMIEKRGSNMPGGFIGVMKEQVSYEKLLHIPFKDRPAEHFRTAIKRHYSTQTIQSPREIEKAIGILGISEFWYKLAREVNRRPGRVKKYGKKTIKEFIQSYIQRRHCIVHEADLFTSKKHNNTKRPLKIGFVKNAINHISIFVHAVEKIINLSTEE